MRVLDTILINERNNQYDSLTSKANEIILTANKTVSILSNLENFAGLPPFERKAEIIELAEIVSSLIDQRVEWRILTRYVNKLENLIQISLN